MRLAPSAAVFLLLVGSSLSVWTDSVIDYEEIRILLSEYRDDRNMVVGEYRRKRDNGFLKLSEKDDELDIQYMAELGKLDQRRLSFEGLQTARETLAMRLGAKMEANRAAWASEREALEVEMDAKIRTIQNELVLKLAPFFDEQQMDDIKEAIYGEEYIEWYEEKEEIVRDRFAHKLGEQIAENEIAYKKIYEALPPGASYAAIVDLLRERAKKYFLSSNLKYRYLMKEKFSVLDAVTDAHYVRLDWFCDLAVYGISDELRSSDLSYWLEVEEIFTEQKNKQ